MPRVNIFLSLRSLGHARHSFSDKTGCFLPVTGCIVSAPPLPATLRISSRGQQTTTRAAILGLPLGWQSRLGTCFQRGNDDWIIACLLRSFSGLDTKALLLQ